MNNNDGTFNNPGGDSAARAAWAPRLAFYHQNARGNGTAVQFEISPATSAHDGQLYLSIAPQDPTPANVVTTSTGKRCAAYQWRNRVCVKLTFVETAEIVQVLAGDATAINHAGKGAFYHSTADAVTTLDMRLADDPGRPGVILSVTRSPKNAPESKQSLVFVFTPAEAYGLRLALEQALFLMAFGLTHSDSPYAIRANMRPQETPRATNPTAMAAAGAEEEVEMPF